MEANSEDDFEENEFMYDDLDLEELSMFSDSLFFLLFSSVILLPVLWLLWIVNAERVG